MRGAPLSKPGEKYQRIDKGWGGLTESKSKGNLSRKGIPETPRRLSTRVDYTGYDIKKKEKEAHPSGKRGRWMGLGKKVRE